MEQTPPTLGRPRVFDPEQTLQILIAQFWKHGYHATSLSDLTAATGLHRGSLYGAFGDKHQMFLKSLSHYAQQRRNELQDDLASEATPLAGLHAFLGRQAALATSGRGCLIANSTLELLPDDHEVAAVIQQHQEAILATFTRVLRQAADLGVIQGKQAPEMQANYVLTVAQGIWESGRLGASETMLHQIIETTLASL